MSRRLARTMVAAGLMMVGAVAWPHETASVACQDADTTPAVAEPNRALEQNPSALDARFRLAAALIDQRCYDAAVHVLEAGEALHPRNAELQAKLRHARSLVSEQQYFEGLDQAERSAKISRNTVRCDRLGDLSACEAALALEPNDPEITAAMADALLQARRVGEALVAYRRAAELGANRTTIDGKLAAASAQRQALMASCQSESGYTALQACRSALVRGENDEFALQKRMAMLLQADNQVAPALDAYLAAASLRRDDRSVALAIVALSESTGRNDAVTLTARGTALLSLGRAREAVEVLRQAQTLAPGMSEIKAELATAERLARTATRVSAVAAPSAPIEIARATTPPSPSHPARTYSNAAEPTRSH